MKQSEYQAKKDESLVRTADLKRQSSRISWTRAGVFFGAALFAALGFQAHMALGWMAIGIGGILFLALIHIHDRIDGQSRSETALQTVLDSYLDRFTERWRENPVDGGSFLTDGPSKEKDLNLFGRDSLYQYICAARTGFGQRALAAKLQQSKSDPERIRGQQDAVRELAGKTDFSIQVQCLAELTAVRPGGKKRMDDAEVVRGLAGQAKGAPSKAIAVLIWILPACTIAAILSVLFQLWSGYSYGLAVGLVLVQFLITLIGYGRNQKLLAPLFHLYDGISAYMELFEAVQSESFQSGYLRGIQQKLEENGGAIRALKQLESTGEMVKVRYNIFGCILGNGILLWDYRCAEQFQKWQARYGNEIAEWLETAGELEALLSLAVLCEVKEEFTFPDIREGEPFLSFQNLKHPLIPDDKAVGNDFELGPAACVITGSNMSGKTTFLRSVGVNLVLAYAGGPVLARRFSASVMTVFSSIRVEDSVSDGISTFYAELLRIKEMVDFCKTRGPMIALIDEIFRGTNSRDRVTGAVETIKRLAAAQSMVFVTTHDFELCALEDTAGIKSVNYHFTESYSGDQIKFDYRIRRGRCRTTNAQHLLRLVGILD